MNRLLVFVLVAVGALLVGILVLTFVGGVGVYLAAGGTRGSGNVISEIREVDDFEQVRICCGMKLILHQGEPTAVQISGDDNLVSRIETNVVGDTLVIEYETMAFSTRPSQQIVCDVTMSDVQGVDASGGSTFEASSLATDSFALETSGGSRAEIELLEADTFQLDVSGGGKIGIDSGRVAEQTVHLNGGGSYRAADLESQHVDVKVSGGANATIWATESLAVEASGGSRVNYYGSPTVSQDVSGGSRVQSEGER